MYAWANTCIHTQPHTCIPYTCQHITHTKKRIWKQECLPVKLVFFLVDEMKSTSLPTCLGELVNCAVAILIIIASDSCCCSYGVMVMIYLSPEVDLKCICNCSANLTVTVLNVVPDYSTQPCLSNWLLVTYCWSSNMKCMKMELCVKKDLQFLGRRLTDFGTWSYFHDSAVIF